jgi:DNA-binding beta-propeller fold protein YncE
VTNEGTVNVLAGTSASGFVDGIGTNAQFNTVQGIACFSLGPIVYVTDNHNNAIRKISSSGRHRLGGVDSLSLTSD